MGVGCFQTSGGVPSDSLQTELRGKWKSGSPVPFAAHSPWPSAAWPSAAWLAAP